MPSKSSRATFFTKCEIKVISRGRKGRDQVGAKPVEIALLMVAFASRLHICAENSFMSAVATFCGTAKLAWNDMTERTSVWPVPVFV